MISLMAVTAFFVLCTAGTVGKLVFDDWQVRRAMRTAKLLALPLIEPLIEKP